MRIILMYTTVNWVFRKKGIQLKCTCLNVNIAKVSKLLSYQLHNIEISSRVGKYSDLFGKSSAYVGLEFPLHPIF